MKYLFLILFLLQGCNNSTASSTCYYMGKELYSNPQGGCYYINFNYNKSYVDSSYCNCLNMDSSSVDI